MIESTKTLLLALIGVFLCSDAYVNARWTRKRSESRKQTKAQGVLGKSEIVNEGGRFECSHRKSMKSCPETLYLRADIMKMYALHISHFSSCICTGMNSVRNLE